jgi:hypothetical protein
VETTCTASRADFGYEVAKKKKKEYEEIMVLGSVLPQLLGGVGWSRFALKLTETQELKSGVLGELEPCLTVLYVFLKPCQLLCL